MSNDLTETKSFLPSIPDPATLKEVLEANFEGISPSFETIKIPTGGLTVWAMPTEGEEMDMQKELVGIVLDHYPVRAYWQKKFGQGEGNVPPDCSSLDAKTGSLPRNEADEYGECSTCAWAQFGTATKPDGSPARGQACNFKHRVYLLMPDKSIFPFLIPLSTMSATKKYDGSFSTYVVKLGGRLKKLHEVVTKIKLTKDKNADGIDYAKAQFYFTSDLNDDQKKQIAALRDMLRPAMRSKPLDVEEIHENGDGVPF